MATVPSNEAQENALILEAIQHVVPKYCTVVNVALTSDRQVILSFLYRDPNADKPVVIERVMLSADHVASLSQTLGAALEKANEGFEA